MSKIQISNLDDYDDLDELYGGTQKINRKHEKHNKNEDDTDFHEPQGLPPGWREGDSHIGLRKKARNYSN